MLRFLVVIAVMVLLPFSASAQQSGPAPAEPPAAAIAPPSAFATAAQIEASKNEILALVEAKYAARLDAMAMDRASFDNLILAVKWLGALGTFALIGFGWLIGRNLNEIKEATKNQARSLFDDEMRKAAEETGSLRSLFDEVKRIEDELLRLRTELSGYSELADVARSATGFDPLVQYKALDSEIDKRRSKTLLLAHGDLSIKIKDTVADPDFRQRAAVIFEKLISTAKEGHEKGNLTIDVNTLLNASKNASAADMPSVALGFLEIASAVSKGTKPEIEASLVRQRITMSSYHTDAQSGGNEQAWADLAKALAATTGFDLHLVVSEAFNLGLHFANPPKMAAFIYDNLPTDLKNVSYAQIIRARLLLMGGQTDADWALGRKLLNDALISLKKKSSSLNWFKHAAEDIAKLLSEDPTLLSDMKDNMKAVFGDTRKPRQFIARFGRSTAERFAVMDLLDEFVDVEATQIGELPPELLEMLMRAAENSDPPSGSDDDKTRSADPD